MQSRSTNTDKTDKRNKFDKNSSASPSANVLDI